MKDKYFSVENLCMADTDNLLTYHSNFVYLFSFHCH